MTLGRQLPLLLLLAAAAAPAAAQTAGVVEPVPLPPIRVEAVRTGLDRWLIGTGFGLRRVQGSGLLHRTRRELRFQSAPDLPALLRQTDGVRIRRRTDGGSELYLGRAPEASGACPADIYLNGVLVELGEFRWTGAARQTAMRALRFDDLLRLEEIDAMELYPPGSSPAAADPDCGALLLWSGSLRKTLDEPFVGTLAGIVEREDAGTVAGAEVRVTPGTLAVTTGADGTFALPALAPGRYVLTVRAGPERTPWSTTVEVKAFADVFLTVTIEERGRP